VPANHDGWTVLPHGPLVALSDNLWRVEGQLRERFPVQRSMLVVRLPDGRLLLNNPVALDDATMTALEALGEPAFLVIPNGWHRMDARNFEQRYPAAKVVCPSGARKRVAQVVEVDLTYEELALQKAGVHARYLDGIKPDEGVLDIRSGDGRSLVFNDLLNNLSAFGGAIGRLYGMFAGFGRPRHHRFVTFVLARDRGAFRSQLERLADEPDLRRIVVAHGATIDDRPAEVLRAIAAGL
jgi:hypothetical protein